jgi:hypothetical protein
MAGGGWSPPRQRTPRNRAPRLTSRHHRGKVYSVLKGMKLRHPG